MGDELPYRAEYAKSGRASCKGCKSPIAKDTLRLAVMVQSPVFDGKQPNWYHFACFFVKQRPKSIGDIAHIDSLRWEDQEKIKQKIASGGGSGSSASASPGTAKSGKGKPSKRKSAVGGEFNDFTVEYAKSSRATCRGCDTKIDKGEVRISKKDFESDAGKRFGGEERWHHVECFAKNRDFFEFWEDGAMLPGFKTLTKEDQQMVASQVPKVAKKEIKKEPTDQTDGPSEAKKIKKEDDQLEKELKAQNKIMFGYRDKLKNELKKPQLTQLLEYNDQEVPVGTEPMLDRLADIMTFGALLPCEECKGGQLVFRSGVGYQCTGDLTEWTKCQFVTTDPKRVPFKVPEDLMDTFLNSYKFVPRKRTIRIITPTAAKTTERSAPKVERARRPLENMEFVILHKTTRPKEELKAEIQKLGGKVVSKVHDKLAAVIGTPDAVEKMGKKVEEAKDLDIQIVSEDFLDEVKDGGATLMINKKSICSWGSDPNSRIPKDTETKSSKSKSRFVKSMPTKQRMKLKGGAVVDPDSGLEDVAEVYQKNGTVYNAVLGITDVQSGKNSFYKLQVLTSGSRFWVFRAWGRIGTTIGGNKLEDMGTLHDALGHFKSLYEEKTGNLWENRDNFMKLPGRMHPIDVDYGQDEGVQKVAANGVESKLPQPVHDLISMIFDVNNMKKLMIEFELDLEKMPLGKLSKKQIQAAYGVLNDLQELVKKGGSDSRFIDASNRFYTLIPHDFGIDNPPIIRTEEVIKQKIELLDSLMEIEIAYSMLSNANKTAEENVHPVDNYYKQLHADIEVLDKSCEEFCLLQKYVENTHAETHRQYELEILEVFKVKRHEEVKRYAPFKKLPNRKLLWHGSRLTNFAGILSQGLRIAPPEAPVTGYMFGKGVYFADMVSKSANYCCTSKTNPVGLLLLCEVALGNMYERTQVDYIEKLPPGKHSTLGLGRTEPNPKEVHVRSDGVIVPVGKGVPTARKNVSLLYNEYIVYDVGQVNIQYLMKVNFKYKF
ncbi:LOW QUALITY PROTEIN: poly [ADP-ribose] polymerase [Schistocerca piceifrons]|uniref:LOW QUALITY PROTEIN: poly [ADP-ribose] polymerase n=1 Tax=Schistocerca piceifrons TaxID=274613 RepID=UPI001F5E7AF5|nr:LOW QUALITY PROTEIN: poly [ADP-ribose] polymerase [Schistocerca piceifrons]